jgi:hypothetical protein
MVVIMQRPRPGPMVSAPPLPRMPSEHRAATHAMARETETSSPREHVSRKETGAPPTTPAAAASTAIEPAPAAAVLQPIPAKSKRIPLDTHPIINLGEKLIAKN